MDKKILALREELAVHVKENTDRIAQITMMKGEDYKLKFDLDIATSGKNNFQSSFQTFFKILDHNIWTNSEFGTKRTDVKLAKSSKSKRTKSTCSRTRSSASLEKEATFFHILLTLLIMPEIINFCILLFRINIFLYFL